MKAPSKISIEALHPEHWPLVRRIYAEGLATGHASEVPRWERWDATHLAAGRRVALVDGEVAGWAALSPVSTRCVYGGVAEVGIYIDGRYRPRGVGLALMEALIEEAENAGIWTLEAGIFPENVGSVVRHRRAGFREVGRRERLGELNGVWRDVVLLERRSQRVGVS